MLTESLVLAGLGGAAGLLVARWTLPALVSLAPAGVPRLESAGARSNGAGGGSRARPSQHAHRGRTARLACHSAKRAERRTWRRQGGGARFTQALAPANADGSAGGTRADRSCRRRSAHSKRSQSAEYAGRLRHQWRRHGPGRPSWRAVHERGASPPRVSEHSGRREGCAGRSGSRSRLPPALDWRRRIERVGAGGQAFHCGSDQQPGALRDARLFRSTSNSNQGGTRLHRCRYTTSAARDDHQRNAGARGLRRGRSDRQADGLLRRHTRQPAVEDRGRCRSRSQGTRPRPNAGARVLHPSAANPGRRLDMGRANAQRRRARDGHRDTGNRDSSRSDDEPTQRCRSSG